MSDIEDEAPTPKSPYRENGGKLTLGNVRFSTVVLSGNLVLAKDEESEVEEPLESIRSEEETAGKVSICTITNKFS